MPAEDSRRRVNWTLGHKTQERQTRTQLVSITTHSHKQCGPGTGMRIPRKRARSDRVLRKHLDWCKTPIHEPPGSPPRARGGHQGRARTCRPRPTTPRIICGQGPMIKRFCRARAAGEARPVRVARPHPCCPPRCTHALGCPHTGPGLSQRSHLRDSSQMSPFFPPRGVPNCSWPKKKQWNVPAFSF